jgi:hypothetical protein
MNLLPKKKLLKVIMTIDLIAADGDPRHAPANAAFHKAGFNVETPCLWMSQKLISN